MDTAIALAKSRPDSGKALGDLRDQFSQFIKDKNTSLDSPEAITNFREMFNPETTQGKSVKALFKDDPAQYEHFSNMSKVLKELGQDFTSNPGARAAGKEAKNVVVETGEALGGQGFSSYRLARIAKDYITNTKQYLSVLDEMRRDPKFATELLEWSKNGDNKKYGEVIHKLQSITSVKGSAAGVGAMAPRASEGQKEQKPRLSANDLKLMEKKNGKTQPIEGTTPPNGTLPKVDVSPQSYKLPEKYKDNPMAAEVAQDIEKFANKHKVPTDIALMVADSESSMGTNAGKNDKSSAQGVFQLTDAAVKDVEKLLGRKINPKNNKDNIEGGIRYIKDVSEKYKKSYDKEPTAWEVKGMFQLGLNGFKSLKDSGDKKVPAWQLMEEAARNHRELFFKDNKALTPKQVLHKFEKKYADNGQS
jgi:hypothetical protein